MYSQYNPRSRGFTGCGPYRSAPSRCLPAAVAGGRRRKEEGAIKKCGYAGCNSYCNKCGCNVDLPLNLVCPCRQKAWRYLFAGGAKLRNPQQFVYEIKYAFYTGNPDPGN